MSSSAETPIPEEPAWSLATALLFVGLWMFLSLTIQIGFVVVAMVAMIVFQGRSQEDAQRVLQAGDNLAIAVAMIGCVALSWMATFALLRRLFRRFQPDQVKRALGLNPPDRRWTYLLGIPVGLALVVATGLITTLLGSSEDETPFGQLLRTPIGAASVVFLALVIAPIAEEIFFRGFVLPPMLRRFSLGTALAFNGAVFAGVHILSYGASMRFTYLPPLFLFGFVLSGMRVGTKSVGPCIVAHVVFNATSILAYLLVESTPPSS